jgi:hypothetical protein
LDPLLGEQVVRLNKHQQGLFEFLKRCEADRKTFTVEQAAQSTGMAEASVRTYLSKKLRGRWVFPVDGGRHEVRGFIDVPAEDFARVMSQKTPAAFASAADWREELEDLVRRGKGQGFDVATMLQQVAEKYKR